SPRISDVLSVRAVEVEVTPVPTYEEMLAWAEETDKRIAAGQLPPLGSRRHPSGAAEAATVTAAAAAAAEESLGETFLSDQEQAQMATVAELLGKRRRRGSPLSEEEESILRTAMAGLSASVDNDEEAKHTNSGDDGAPVSVPGSNVSPSSQAPAPDDGGGRADDLVHNQIYGSREVRDKVYLYAWSLMKNRQEKAERKAA
ncbi:unnamed protein product, partial [Scytosiphon promiscuus]